MCRGPIKDAPAQSDCKPIFTAVNAFLYQGLAAGFRLADDVWARQQSVLDIDSGKRDEVSDLACAKLLLPKIDLYGAMAAATRTSGRSRSCTSMAIAASWARS
jgi:hypothetical protein